jgi:PAS domain S-box-containing protein
VLDVLGRLADRLSQASGLCPIYDAVLDALRDGLGITHAAIHLADDGDVGRLVASRGLSDTYRAATQATFPRMSQLANGPLVIPDVHADALVAPTVPALDAEGITAIDIVPLRARGETIGACICYHTEPRTFDAAESAVALTAAHLLAFAIERTRGYDALRRSDERLRFALGAAGIGIWEWDLRTNQIRWSENLVELHGAAGASFDGTFASYEREIHPDDRPAVLESIRRAIADATPHEMEYRLLAPDGSVRWVEGKGRVEYDEQGRPERMAGICVSITRRKQVELERAKLAERAEFLSAASETLSGSLDYETTLKNITTLAVPRIADWCTVHMRRADGTIQTLAVSHVDDPGISEAVAKIGDRFPVTMTDSFGPGLVLRTGDPILVATVPRARIESLSQHADFKSSLLTADIRSAMVVPIRTSRQIVGTLSFMVTGYSGRQFGPADLSLAEAVSHRAAMAVENAQLYAEAQEANRTKDDFLATLSHELRTPLNAILGWSRMLERGHLDGHRAQQAVASIRRNAEVQSRLIGDILDVARIMSGKLRLEPERVDVSAVVTAAVAALQGEADEHGVSICLDIEGPLVTEADPARLHQVVWNLVSNAVKFAGSQGRVTVTVRREDTNIIVQVDDDGAGIVPDFLPHLFERFRQADGSVTRRHTGLGLGLAITRHLVQLHGGTVTASSAGEGRGASFSVRVPFKSLEPGPPIRTRPPAPLGVLNGQRVLVVDDHEDSRALAATVLTRAGADVDLAGSAVEAMTLIGRQRYALFVADLAMPDEDGITLLTRIRALGATATGMPALAISAHVREEDRRRALAGGFQAYLAKPIDQDVLLETAARLLSR